MDFLKLYTVYENEILIFMSYWMIFVGVVTFGFLLKKSAPYGRYTNNSFGKLAPAHLSWLVMEFPPVMITLGFNAIKYYYVGMGNSNYILMLFTTHYVYRSLVYSRLIRNGQPMPIFTAFLAFTFCTYNGLLQSLSTLHGDVDISLMNVIGIVIFGCGLMINIVSDHQLRMLRTGAVNEPRYKIPRGLVFEYVSCANYLGEIIEWGGYALAAQSWASLAFALFTCFNLVPRALSHHEWYRAKFDNYPRNRRAVIPWIL